MKTKEKLPRQADGTGSGMFQIKHKRKRMVSGKIYKYEYVTGIRRRNLNNILVLENLEK